MQHTNAYYEGIHKAKVSATQDIYKKYYRLCLEQDMPLPVEMKELRKVYLLVEELSKKRTEDIKIYMLTINPLDDPYWEQLEKIVPKLLSYKNFLIDAEVQYEQRSEDENNPYGFHVHIACKLGRSTKNTIDTVFSTVRKYLPGILRSSIDLRLSKNAYEYVKGNKGDDSKNRKMEVDEIIRQKKLLT